MSGGKKKTPTGGATNVANATYGNFFADLLASIGLGNITQAQRTIDEQSLAAVAHFEGLNTRYNPLNSVVPYGTSTSFNSVGVQDYKNYRQGVAGTSLLLTGPNHSSIWDPVDAALKSGSQSDILSAFDSAYQSWGSNGPVPISQTEENQIVTGSVGKGAESKLPPKPGSDLSILGGAIKDTAGGVVGVITKPFDILKSLYSDVTSVDWWIRIGFIILGLVILLIAIDKVTSGGITGTSGGSAPDTIDVITSTTGSAATQTGQAAKSAGSAAKSQVQKRTYSAKHQQTKPSEKPSTSSKEAGKKPRTASKAATAGKVAAEA